jgi:hypothetical protein
MVPVRRIYSPLNLQTLFSNAIPLTWGRIASLIETAKINGIEPFAYLKANLEAIAVGHPNDRLDALLPWNWAPTSS